MEKLIELLNEYEIKRMKTKMDITDKRTEGDLDNEYTPLIIISKKFGFIKWLVDNYKIDLGKTKKLYRKSNEHSVHTYPIMYEYSEYESLLMLLAISDTPIDDLISYLR